MKSIRVRIMFAICICSLVALIVVSSISLFMSNNTLRTYGQSNVEMLAENSAMQINSTMNEIETSVQDISIMLTSMIDDVSKFQKDQAYVEKYQEQIRPLVKEIAENTNGAMTFYVRFNPEFTAPTSGLFHADLDANGEIEQLVPTDFSQYDASDVSHVGWYYLPIEAGEAIWLDRYFNENVKTDMVSYVVPLFKDGVTIGVVGMDINFEVFSTLVSGIKPYDSSYAMLINDRHQFLIHPEFDISKTTADLDVTLDAAVNENKTGSITIPTDQGDALITYTQLDNGQHLLVQSLESEIYSEIRKLIIYMVLTAIGMVALATAAAFIVGDRITRPIIRLVKDMQLVQAGDLTIQTEITTKDETSVIGKNFNAMVNDLRKLTQQIEQVSQHIDSSTSSLNRSAEDIIQSSEEAAASVEEIATGNRVQSQAIELCSEIASNLTEQGALLKGNTEQVVEDMDVIKDRKDSGLRLMNELIAINTQNQLATQQIETAIVTLDEKADYIQSLIGQIKEIADQTNLLALNASIESARAGEAGRGFSVVAAEIRKLAEQSNRSAVEINDVLTHIQQNSNAAVESLFIVKQRRGEQDIAIEQVNEAFQMINHNIQGIDHKLSENAASIHHLLQDAQKLAGEIVEIVAIAEQSSAASDQVANAMQEQTLQFESVGASIQNLNNLVIQLRQQIAHFKITK